MWSYKYIIDWFAFVYFGFGVVCNTQVKPAAPDTYVKVSRIHSEYDMCDSVTEHRPTCSGGGASDVPEHDDDEDNNNNNNSNDDKLDVEQVDDDEDAGTDELVEINSAVDNSYDMYTNGSPSTRVKRHHQHQQQQQQNTFANRLSQQPVSTWSPESVGQWLAINNLGIYMAAFLDKKIDGETLLDLDTSRLKVRPRFIIISLSLSFY